jgi:broad specificity phosphatase PhoE
MPPAVTWLVRHGQSAANAGLPTPGQEEVPLTPLGLQQAAALAQRIDRAPTLIVVSPFLRARATAAPILQRWPAAHCETWPIQELTYLSPARCRGTTPETRRPMVAEYWKRGDPDYLDASDAETFRSFVERLRQFHQRLAVIDGGFVVAVGHGQFFRGYTVAMAEGFDPTAAWMSNFRASEVANPIANGEIIEVSGEAVRCVN